MTDIKKKKAGSAITYIFLFLLIVLPILWVLFLKRGEHFSAKLPIYFERAVGADGDTLYHTIEDFEFTNQLGQKITSEDIKGKIVLVNFFFATCPDVCPRINSNIQYIYREFLKNQEVIFLSHTVDPEHDSPEVLLEYSKRFGAEAPKWNFLTGSKALLYDMAEHSYRIPGAEDAAHNGFFHSENIVLVDKEGRVRGIFHGMKGMQKDGNPKIIDAVRALMYEYNQPEKIAE